MKTNSPRCSVGANLRRWLLPVGVAAPLFVGWGCVRLQAAEPLATLPPVPEVKLQKIPVLRLQKRESPANTKKQTDTAKQSGLKLRSKKAVVTGSKIPQKISQRRLMVTASPVIVIDRREMSRTGAQTASQLFGRMSFGR